MASTEWAAKTRSDGRGIWERPVSVAIGQGVVSVSPIGMATMMATVANGARCVPRTC